MKTKGKRMVFVPEIKATLEFDSNLSDEEIKKKIEHYKESIKNPQSNKTNKTFITKGGS